MKKVNVQVEIKQFRGKNKNALGLYHGLTIRGTDTWAKISINSDQAPNEMYKTAAHEFGHLLLDYLNPQLRDVTLTPAQLERNEQFCRDLEKAVSDLYTKWADEGAK